ncbi:MAG: hypothetical protein LBT64_02025 [Puniceicoccales bacterium]|nr:hypothetical protein [Puniceicoccales bacterium]
MFCVAALLNSGLRADDAPRGDVVMSLRAHAPKRIKSQIWRIFGGVLGQERTDELFGKLFGAIGSLENVYSPPRGMSDVENFGISFVGSDSSPRMCPVLIFKTADAVHDSDANVFVLSKRFSGWTFFPPSLWEFSNGDQLAKSIIETIGKETPFEIEIVFDGASFANRIRAAKAAESRNESSEDPAEELELQSRSALDGVNETTLKFFEDLVSMRIALRCGDDTTHVTVNETVKSGSDSAKKFNSWKNNRARLFDVVPRDCAVARYNSWYSHNSSPGEVEKSAAEIEKICEGMLAYCRRFAKQTAVQSGESHENADGTGPSESDNATSKFNWRTADSLCNSIAEVMKFTLRNFSGDLHIAVTKSGEICAFIGMRSDKKDSRSTAEKFRDLVASLKVFTLKKEKNYGGFEIYGMCESGGDCSKCHRFAAAGENVLVIVENAAGIGKIHWLVDLYAAKSRSKAVQITDSKIEEIEIDLWQTIGGIIAQRMRLAKADGNGCEDQELNELAKWLQGMNMRIRCGTYVGDDIISVTTGANSSDLVTFIDLIYPEMRDIFHHIIGEQMASEMHRDAEDGADGQDSETSPVPAEDETQFVENEPAALGEESNLQEFD